MVVNLINDRKYNFRENILGNIDILKYLNRYQL